MEEGILGLLGWWGKNNDKTSVVLPILSVQLTWHRLAGREAKIVAETRVV